MTTPSLPLLLKVLPPRPDHQDEAGVRLFESGNTFNWQVDGSSEALGQAVELIVRTEVDALGGAALPLAEVVGRLQLALTNAGYAVEIEADRTLQVTGEFDMRTARMLTQADGVDDDLLRGLHRALETGLRAPGRKLASMVLAAMTKGEVQVAVDAVESALREGTSAFFGNDPDLFAAIDEIPDAVAKDRPDFLKVRMALGYGLEAWRQLERDARFYLIAAAPTGTERGTIENTIAAAMAGQGMTQAACSEWRRLLKRPGALDAGDRGWAWRNLARTLPPSSAEALAAARASVDAFLEAGDKTEALVSQVTVGERLLHSDTGQALQHFETLLSQTATPGLMNAEHHAALHHHYADCLRQLRRHEDGLVAVEAAIAAREMVIGAEDQLGSSLHLAAILARNAGRPEQAAAFTARATALVTAGLSSHFAKVTPMMGLLDAYDGEQARTALADAVASGDRPTILALETLIATEDPDLSHADRIARLERALQANPTAPVREQRPVRLAVGMLLEAEGEYAAAAVQYRQILNHEASALDIRDRLIDCLAAGGQWTELAAFLTAEFNRSRSATIGLALVDVHLRGGDPKAALKAARVVRSGSDLTPEQAERLDRECLRAIDLGAVYEAAGPQTRSSTPIGRAEIEEALDAFGHHVSGEVRMTFWRASDKKGGDHAWCAAPEQNGQTLLHTFLRGRFGDRIEAFQEVGAGAGRIDLLLQFDALKVIVELKLCGYRYSADYAAGGSDQLVHYMKARDVHLGYLLVFDARLDDFGDPLDVAALAESTLKTVLIDVRPRVSKRTRKPKN